ncbi:MAG: hypothetical protein RL180_261 [Pseudomonadota bacterium]
MNIAAFPDLQIHPAFECVRRIPVDALSVELLEFRHRVTGAAHFHLAADNDENVFVVGFRTQPMDSRGVAHILEHTALCGSARFPVRDPFFSMIRRSLNTFMNAFTASDWTAYPFATQNRTDFFNLLSVYLDAAFFPNLHPLDFAQEGIRVELEDGKPVYKGIVFNEMKGAMSSPTDQLYHRLAHHLYPQTTYHYNSGGDPAVIPDLSHQDLIDFHRSHYHPSNAVLMTYGNLSPFELQTAFETQALAQFGTGERRHPKPEQRLTAPLRVVDTYAVDEPDLSAKTHIVLAWLLPPSTDMQTRMALRLVEGVLMEDSSSPLRQYLETCGLGESPSPLLGLDDSNYEMTFYCGIQGSEAAQADALEAGVLQVLEQCAAAPIDPAVIDAVLHQIELNQREIGGDGTPYGLQLLLNGLSCAIQDGDPLAVWQLEPLLAWMREQLADPMWLPSLIRQHLIDNPHRVRLTLSPDAEQTARMAAAEQARLDAIAAQLDPAQCAHLNVQAQALADRQATVDDINLLPKVGLADVPATLHVVQGETVSLTLGDQTAPLYRYAAGTNGLYYQQVLIAVPPALLNTPLLSIYTSLLGELGAGELDYLQLQQAQTASTGGLHMGASLRSTISDGEQISAWLVLSTKALAGRHTAFGLLRMAFESLRFDETDRITELLQQRKSRWQSRLSGAGHSYALQTAVRNMSALARHEYHNGGLPTFVWLRDLMTRADTDATVIPQLIADLHALHQQLLALPREYLLIAEAARLDALQAELQQVWQAPLTATPSTTLTAQAPAAPVADADQAWLIQANVQFCAAAYPATPVDHPDTAALMVLGPYLKNGFLHRALREQGGAYGGGAGYDGNACAFRFFSYRDPRMAETFVDFQASIDWLNSHAHEPHQLEEAILGLMASMDKPGSPAGEAVTTCHAALHGRTPARRQALRQALLAVTEADLLRVAQTYLQPEQRRRAVVAPYGKADELAELGFVVERI